MSVEKMKIARDGHPQKDVRLSSLLANCLYG